MKVPLLNQDLKNLINPCDNTAPIGFTQGILGLAVLILLLILPVAQLVFWPLSLCEWCCFDLNCVDFILSAEEEKLEPVSQTKHAAI